MQKAVTFNHTGYEPFLDFIKAYAIIMVLVGHTFPYQNYVASNLWIGMQVPLFILVQSFHALKKDKPVFSFKKTMTRVFIPFLAVEAIAFVFMVFVMGCDYKELIYNYLTGGGIGPGAYFPWVYLQIAILLPMLRPLFNHGARWMQALIAIAVCEGLQVFASVIDIPAPIYRLLAFRYLFLIFLGWIWVKDGIRMNKTTLLLSLLSLTALIYFSYFQGNDEPLFYDTRLHSHRWPSYYYVAILFTYLLYLLYRKTYHYKFVEKSVRLLAKCSYEIFLLQMVVIAVCPAFSFIPEPHIEMVVRIASIFFISIYGGYLFNIAYNKLLK